MLRFNGAPMHTDSSGQADLDTRIAQLSILPSPFEKTAPTPSKPAEMVGQGQAGFSRDQPLGTMNIGACVGVIARDPSTGDTACIHVDRGTSPASLGQSLKELGSGPLDVMLLGGHYRPGADVRASEIIDSRNNIEKVLAVLEKHGANIVAADVQSADSIADVTGNQRTNIFVDPVTFSIHRDLPKNPAPDGMLAYMKPIMTGGKGVIPLDTVYDQRKGYSRIPPVVTAKEAEVFESQINGNSHENIADWFRSRPGFRDEGNWIDTCATLAQGWNDQYQTAKAGAAAALGVTPESLRGKALHIGQGADAANTALYASAGAQTKGAAKAAPQSKLS